MKLFAFTLLFFTIFLRLSLADPEAVKAEPLRLESVHAFAMGGIGIRGIQSKEERAYLAVLRGPDAAKVFREVLQTGTPEAKLYALCGLHAVAPSEFEAAASLLASSELTATTISGCIIRSERVAEVVRRIRDDYREQKEQEAAAVQRAKRKARGNSSD
jgi:hypothetical protein